MERYMSDHLKSESGIRRPRHIGLAASALVLVALATCAILVMSARAWIASSLLVTKQANAPAQAKPRPVRIGRELITIHPFGFEPAEITRSARPFLLEVQNRSGLREVSLRLDREAGNRLREVKVPRKELDWRAIQDLPPGRYLLTEEKHPAWLCRITITAR